MTAEILNTSGLVLNLGGVVLLFLFGMPFHVPTGGMDILALNPNPDAAKIERRNKILGAIGLFLIVLGTGLQIAANWTVPVT